MTFDCIFVFIVRMLDVSYVNVYRLNTLSQQQIGLNYMTCFVQFIMPLKLTSIF